MDRSRLWAHTPFLIAGYGALLFAAAVAHHVGEIRALEALSGPLLALVFDGVPALALVFAGYWVGDTDLSGRDHRTVLGWCLAGSALLVAVIGATIVVRAAEGRVIAEPIFPLLIAAEAGAIAGVIAGYNHARARREVRRATTINDAMAFVNDLIRHDLRNDLAVIQGEADMIDRAGGDGETDGSPETVLEKTNEALERIETSSEIVDTLVGQPDLEPVDLVPIVGDLAVRLEDAHRVDVTTDLPAEATVVANAGVRPIVDNLLENAAEHNDADDPHVAVAVETDADVVRLTVRDNGPGLPEELQQSIETGEHGPKRGGLSLVQTLVSGFGGDLRVSDNQPRGATVVVELPRAEAGDGDRVDDL